MFLTDLITQTGLRALTEFTICAAPQYGEDLKRVEGNDGLMIACTRDHDDGRSWRKQWPGHVEAPTLRQLAIVAQQHWLETHHAEAQEGTEAGGAK